MRDRKFFESKIIFMLESKDEIVQALGPVDAISRRFFDRIALGRIATWIRKILLWLKGFVLNPRIFPYTRPFVTVIKKFIPEKLKRKLR